VANKLDMILKLKDAQDNIVHLRKGTCQKRDMYVEYDMLYNYVDCLLTGLMKDVVSMPSPAPVTEYALPHAAPRAMTDGDKLNMMFEYMYKTDPTFKLYVDSR
jgi:hypothetical protein